MESVTELQPAPTTVARRHAQAEMDALVATVPFHRRDLRSTIFLKPLLYRLLQIRCGQSCSPPPLTSHCCHQTQSTCKTSKKNKDKHLRGVEEGVDENGRRWICWCGEVESLETTSCWSG
ncbi:putative cholesterol side-chain cleavage enzyme, mitochondrial [Sesbania bispinosa]|nr:putative cholesterol side-chain cleavage enzyme, mitochondrial [Sesbania bispinosa]